MRERPFVGDVYARALFAIAALLLALPPQSFAKSYPIRDRDAPCGFYLVSKADTTRGERLTKNLSPSELRGEIQRRKSEIAKDIRSKTDAELRKLAGERLGFAEDVIEILPRMTLELRVIESYRISPEKDMIYGVGPMGMIEARKLSAQGKKVLASEGLDKVRFKSIRQVREVFEERKGIWSIDEDGRYYKVAKLENSSPGELEKSVRTLIENDPEKPYFFVGAPVFSTERNEIKEALGSEYDQSKHVFKSRLLENTKALWNAARKDPKGALRYVMDELVYFFPRGSDFQKPSFGEFRNLYMKVLLPGVLVYSVLTTSTDMPQHVLVPVTLANASSSTFTALWSSFIKNWWSRSRYEVPTTLLKSFMTTAFFVFPVAVGNVMLNSDWKPQWSEMMFYFTSAGMISLALSKWMSVLFNVSWRFPMHTAAYKGEDESKKNALKYGDDEHQTGPPLWDRIKESVLAKSEKYLPWTLQPLQNFLLGSEKFFEKSFSWLSAPKKWEEDRRAEIRERSGEEGLKKYIFEHARFVRTLIERYVSLATTPFFVMSIVASDFLFKIVNDPEKGLTLATKSTEVAADATTMLNFNNGHLVMAGIGLASMIALFSKGFRDFSKQQFSYLGSIEQSLLPKLTKAFKKPFEAAAQVFRWNASKNSSKRHEKLKNLAIVSIADLEALKEARLEENSEASLEDLDEEIETLQQLLDELEGSQESEVVEEDLAA